MNFRSWITKNPAAVTVLAAVALSAALYFLYRQTRSTPVPTAAHVTVNPVYYYDLAKQELFIAKDDNIPPIPSPSNPSAEAVRAYVYSCGDCAHPKPDDIAYLEKFSAAARKAQETMKNADPNFLGPTGPGSPIETIQNGHLVRPLDKKDWAPINSPSGQQVTNAAINKDCGGKKPQECIPPRR